MKVGGYIIELREGPEKVERPAADADAARWAARFYGACGLAITAAGVIAVLIGGPA